MDSHPSNRPVVKRDQTPSRRRIVVRRPDALDVGAVFRIFSEPRTQVLGFVEPVHMFEDAERTLLEWQRHWDAHHFGPWAIANADCPERVIGFGGLSTSNSDDDCVEMGLRFTLGSWNPDHAFQLVKMATDLAFETLGMREINAIVESKQMAWRRVLEAVGLRLCDLDDVVVASAQRSLLYRIQRQIH
jgi:[ribosomal protein S5]-alanine N-acetyltransferase